MSAPKAGTFGRTSPIAPPGVPPRSGRTVGSKRKCTTPSLRPPVLQSPSRRHTSSVLPAAATAAATPPIDAVHIPPAPSRTSQRVPGAHVQQPSPVKRPRFSRTPFEDVAVALPAPVAPSSAGRLQTTWARKPGDDVDTPQWVLRCVEPVLSRSGAEQVYDPFYSSGSAFKSWARLGWKCLHPNVDFFERNLRPNLIEPCPYLLVSQPPASLLARLFKSALRLIPRWAILVPSAFCLQDVVHDVGALSSIAITTAVSLCMNGVPIRSKRMTWLVKGIHLPGGSLHTKKGHCFWTLGKGEVFTRSQIAGVPPPVAPANATKLTSDDLDSLRSELVQLCVFFAEPTNVSMAQSAARTICARLRQPSVAHIGTSAVRKLVACMVTGASMGPLVAEDVVSCCEALASTGEAYILREVVKALPKIVSSSASLLERCVRVIVEAIVKAEVDKKCVTRCRGAVSSLLLVHPGPQGRPSRRARSIYVKRCRRPRRRFASSLACGSTPIGPTGPRTASARQISTSLKACSSPVTTNPSVR